MKWSILVFLLAFVQFSSCFLKKEDLESRPDLQACYNIKYGQVPSASRQDYQPMAHSMETFVAVVERLEASRSARSADDIIRKLLTSYRIDSLANWGPVANARNSLERALFGVTPKVNDINFQNELSEEERCGVHFVLSHAINFTATTGSFEEVDEKRVLKHPRESGVVSLQGKWIHAIALDKVLLGILGGLTNKLVDSSEICRITNCKVTGVKVNPLFAATLGDLTSAYVYEQEMNDREKDLQENGKWNDLSCPNEYILNENVGKSVLLTNAMVRGAIDGLVIGYKITKNLEVFRNIPLSQILRMYYGRTGMPDDPEANWCNRDRTIQSIGEVKEEIVNFYKLYVSSFGGTINEDTPTKIEEALKYFETTDSILREVKDESESCSTAETVIEKCTTPFDIFAVLDWQATDQLKNFQTEVIGNLSTIFDVRPRGSSVGVYRNSKYGVTGLEVIANNTEGATACSACFIRYNTRSPTRIGEVEVFEKLNQTLTSFVEAYDNAQSLDGENNKAGAPAKIILYFNYGSPTNDYKLGEAVWEVKRSFQETTVLAIGTKKDTLAPFTHNDDLDIFTESSNAAAFISKLKARLCKVPAEFQYKECERPSQFSSSDSSQEAVIGLNKRQYWAMYPKYFLKSFRINMKFKPQDGAKIKVCFTRDYFRLSGENAQYMDCKESSGDEITYYVSNPCHKRTLHNCDPFYFLVEGKQVSPSLCTSPRCSTPKDILFEFQHDGIACNTASFLSVSMLSLLIAGLLVIIQRH